MTANDPDSETNGLVTYSLEALPEEEGQPGATQMFSIHEESGWITTTQEADCEAVRLYRFAVVATDNGGGGLRLSSSVLVEVTVTDENDNPPEFSQQAYRGSVVENSSPGEVLVSMTTADADVSLENRLVTCYITGETSPVVSRDHLGSPGPSEFYGSADDAQWNLLSLPMFCSSNAL